jgi:very-short-patch-repair endonuclease
MKPEFLLAERQYGVITHAQLTATGLSESQIKRRVAAQRLEILHPNVFRVVGSVRSARQRAKAATLWLGDDALLSFLTSGNILRLDGMRTREVAVTVPLDCRLGRGQSAVTIHRSFVSRSEYRVVDNLPCTSAARTLVDCAALLDDDALEAAMESARRMGLATLTTIVRAADAAGRRPGITRLRRVVAAAEARPKDSRLEVRLARLLRESALPPSVAQFPLLSYRLDRAWPDRRFAVEADGFQYHGRFLLWKRDRQRVAAIEAAGWRIMHVTWDDLTRHPAQTLDRITHALSTKAA